MTNRQEGGSESMPNRFEQEVVEPTKRAMEEAMSEATSEGDTKQRITDALPKDRSYLGPLVLYMERGEGDEKVRNISALVQTLDDENRSINIEAHFVG